jgi:gas vesicle protein
MRMLRMMLGLALGALVGAGFVLLFSPQSGAEIRDQIQGWFQRVVTEGREAAETRRLELAAQLEELKRPQPAG